MKNHIWKLLALIVLSCSSSRDVKLKEHYLEFKIAETPLILENETIYLNELRIYKTYSAMDGMRLMQQNFGEGNNELTGKHTQYLKRIIWQDVKLLDEKDETFTVITDGIESKKAYFTCIMVFDSEGRNCFNPEHPYREQLIDFFVEKMKSLERKPPREIIRIISY